MTSILKTLEEKFSNETRFNKKLANYSWFNTGGHADIFFRPNDTKQLAEFVKLIKHEYKKFITLGAGSNTLIRDGGVKGVVIKLGPKFSHTKLLKQNVIEVGAATLDKKVSEFAAENNIGGLEFLSCIPGSIGGGVRMNCGCYGGDISKILTSVKVMDGEGNIKDIKKEEICFYYRGCDLPNTLILLSAELTGVTSNFENIKEKQNELINRKKISQPSQVKTCGSTFKNPKSEKAWTLIKKSNCENMSVGKAHLSKKHCNFLINSGDATSLEIEELINNVRNKVHKETGVNLELEIKIIGTDK